MGSGYVQRTRIRAAMSLLAEPERRVHEGDPPLWIRPNPQGQPVPHPQPMAESPKGREEERRDSLEDFLDELHTIVGVEDATPEEARAAREARAAARRRRGPILGFSFRWILVGIAALAAAVALLLWWL